MADLDYNMKRRGIIIILFMLLSLVSVYSDDSVSDLFFTLDTAKVSPGENVKITGFAKDDSGNVIKKADVRLIIYDIEYKTQIKDGELSYKFKIPETIESGSQDIKIYVSDKNGNVQDTLLKIRVFAVPTEIEFVLQKLNYIPEENIETIAILKDQAGDELNVELNALFKKGRRIILSQTVPAGEMMKLQIPRYTKSGKYLLVFKYNDLETKKTMEVEDNIKTKISIENQGVVLENVGNVKNKDKVEIFAEEKLEFTDLVSLSVAEKQSLDLSNELDTGTYSIRIVFGKEEATFEDVSIVGKKKISITWFYKFIIFFLIVLVIYTLWNKKEEFKNMFSFGKGGQEEGPTYIRREPKKEEHKMYKYPRFSSRKEEESDFKERILKGIKETEKRKRKEEGGEGSLFRMFD